MEKYYLKPNLVGEPLFDRWYAWSHLISPATAAFNIKHRHIDIMQSFVQKPELHEMAVKTPHMKGGPFIDYPRERKEDIRELLEETLRDQQELLEFANAVWELNQLLLNEADGHSLTPLYERIPEPLRGYVELAYDVNNRPTFRFFEALLYASRFYKPSSQSMAFYLIDKDDDRPFVLSTPRLKEPHILDLAIPFNHPGIDEIYRLERQPQTLEYIKNALGVGDDQEELLRSFLSTEAPQPYKRYEGDGLRVRYFGHACILVESRDVSILVDPLVSYGYESELSRFTYADLPDQIDFVLITHNHQDHVLYETLLRIRHKVKHIVVPRSSMGDLQDPSLRLNLLNVGFSREQVIELADMEKVEVRGCEITGLPFMGEHSDLDIRSKLCHHFNIHQKFTILFAADSQNIEPRLYQNIHGITGDIDVIFLGMECDGAPLSWLYGPIMPEKLARSKDQSRRLAGCNFDQAIDLVNRFNPRDVFVYAMGMEPWLEYISSIKYTDESKPIIESNRLIEVCKSQGRNAQRLYGEKTLVYEDK